MESAGLVVLVEIVSEYGESSTNHPPASFTDHLLQRLSSGLFLASHVVEIVC
jgi:hypothetical protein